MPTSYSQNKKPELLSPAGTMECFFAAVENGADAIYFGLQDFSARAGAINFTLADASKAIACAHKNAVKVYIALNTLIKTSEMERVADLVLALEEMQPDALIIQDFGLLSLLQSRFPLIKLHASTQMTIHNLAGVKQLERLGFKRVVLARELSIDEITNIAQNATMEIEVFVHGALCYSYSGLCFLSSMTGGRSGNRGRCAQPCRMRYQTSSGDGGYLFSMKDLLTISQINKLKTAGVHSFKIEGRMKSPEYVAVVTNAYRQAIDGRLHDEDDTIRRMKTVFSRETTHAYLFHEDCRQTINSTNHQVKAADAINPSYPANIGSYAGEVIDARRGYVVIRADSDIGVRDLLQVFDNAQTEPSLLPVKTIAIEGKQAYEVHKGDVATIGSEKRFMPGARLYLISSQKIKETFRPTVPKKLISTRIPVNVEVNVRSDGISVKGTVRNVTLTKDYPLKLERGIHRVIEEAVIRNSFSRLGETPFELRDFLAKISENLFIPLSTLNEIRRDYFQQLSASYEKENANWSQKAKKWLKEVAIEYRDQSKRFSGEDEIRLSLKTDRLHYLNYVPLEKIYKIYLVLTNETIENLTAHNDYNQIPLNKGEMMGLFRSSTQNNNQIISSLARDKVVFSLPAIMRDMGNGFETYGFYKKVIEEFLRQGFRQFQISNLGAMDLFKGDDVQWYADYPLYCMNPLSAARLTESGFCRYTLSPEDDNENMQTLFSANTDLIIYQDTPLFTSETCVWANMKRRCPGMSQCSFRQVTVENEYGDRFIAINDRCKTVVLGEDPFSLTHRIPNLIAAGQRDFRIDLCWRDYTPEMIKNIFSGIQNRTEIKYSTIGNFERGLK
ncbi:collagenase-like protease, PrtC family [Candidatus Brocadia pituitae]|nr:collagenase-like protease, PrtC family [Candidatus Brocadia pituitae]